MQKRVLFFIVVIFSLVTFSQKKDSIFLKNGINKPSLLPIHHFGIFSARINQNFRIRPVEKSELQITYASANTFHPFVEMYIPKSETTRDEMRALTWFNRNFFSDQKTTPAEYSSIIVDAVFKNFRIDFTTRVNKNNELNITLRSYLVTKGKFPFSTITGDEFIEWFHSNIAGGEDPFGRRYYGLNQVNVNYKDRNGNILELKNGQFLMAGIELNHFYYPKIKRLANRDIFLNFGSHLGLNTSKFNPSLDVGLSGNISKAWQFKNNNEFRSGFGTALLHKNILNFGDVVELGNNRFLGSLEAMIEFTKKTSKKNYHSLGVNYQVQTSFNKQDEANYYQLVGKWQEIHSGWQNGFEKLAESQSAWSFLYTYGGKNFSFTTYIKQDFYLNNSPDIQTGIALKIPISKH